ncbi:MAG: D-alanyl-D-alanine carboxypeptidase/D-alanyl-D-alanine-endopeptidase [Bacteroidota bacterium]
MRNHIFNFSVPIFVVAILSSCSIQKKISKEANQDILQTADFAAAHVGISIYDPSTDQYLYNYQADKFFVPASNTKIFTCYAAMKYLGDSLIGIRYVNKGNGIIEVEANGDPSFLHPNFPNQPMLDFLKKQNKILLTDDNWKDNALGSGWAWDDFNSDYMPERSMLPVYGNLVSFSNKGSFSANPSFFQKPLEDAVVNAKGNFTVRREFGSNQFYLRPSATRFSATAIPFYTAGNKVLLQLLNDTIQNKVELIHSRIDRSSDLVSLYTQSTDSLLKIMMHVSDNFFAEQCLLMISNNRLAYMNTAKIIDTLLKADLSDLPQKPKWVDGSGLSRYNLFSPRDFVAILTKMKNEFSWNRITNIFETGGTGTISNYYKNYAGRIYAKTGSLSNHIALSGYLITKKGKQLIFSVLVNAHQAPVANIRKGVEKLLTSVMDKY